MKTTVKKTNIIGLKEFRQNAEGFISRIKSGESFTVVKRSHPVFKLTPIDDEEMWETVVDFTTIAEDGVSASDVLSAIKKVHG